VTKLDYTPLDVKIHKSTLKLLGAAFQDHEHGLPEWVKNASDEYMRRDVEEGRRIIVLIFSNGRGTKATTIGCLDLSGMTSSTLENDFVFWGDPEAASRGKKVKGLQGGHGNGGKCYMTQMFDEYAYVHTVRDRKGCLFGVPAGDVQFGYIPNPETSRNYVVSDLSFELERALEPLNCSIACLPRSARDVIATVPGFTLVAGLKPKHYGNKVPIASVFQGLVSHPLMTRSIDLCDIYVIANGSIYNGGKPLSLPEIPPYEFAKDPRVVSIPTKLKDPLSEQHVSTLLGDDDAPGTLTLYTSEKNMQAPRFKARDRHAIRYITNKGDIGFVPVSQLAVYSSFTNHLFGVCELAALEQYMTNERRTLADCPLTRAVNKFISEELDKYAKEFEDREKRKYGQKEKKEVSRLNELLNRWKNKFLDEVMRGLWGGGEGRGPVDHVSLPSGIPVRTEMTMEYTKAGIGVSFKPSIRFFNKDGRRVRPIPYSWISTDTNVAMVDEDRNIINTFSIGRTDIYAETLDGKLKSNEIQLDVVNIHDINIVPNTLELPVGTRQKLTAVCQLSDKSSTSDVCLEWTESNDRIARISSTGMVYGFEQGEIEVVAGDDRCIATDPANIKVIPGGEKGPGKKKGKGYPEVLISNGFDVDPYTDEPVILSEEYPPIWQRPIDVDRNIWWINSAAPMAAMFLDPLLGYGFDSQAWRIYHVERFIEAIVQMIMTTGPESERTMSPHEWVYGWGEKAMQVQAAAFLELADYIRVGKEPEVE